MILLECSFCWKPADSRHDVPFLFICPPEADAIRITFSFSPGMESSEALCIPQIEAAMTRYYDQYPRALQKMKAENFLPVKNLITISLDHAGEYIGNAHRWAPEQQHMITTEQASLGFVPPEKLEGEWSGMLHLHEIISPICQGYLKIEGVCI